MVSRFPTILHAVVLVFGRKLDGRMGNSLLSMGYSSIGHEYSDGDHSCFRSMDSSLPNKLWPIFGFLLVVYVRYMDLEHHLVVPSIQLG